MAGQDSTQTIRIGGVERDLSELIACPKCDLLHKARQPDTGTRATCRRCHAVLIAPRAGAYLRIVALAVTAMILMLTAVFMPFLRLETMGLHSDASIFDAAFAFAEGPLMPLVVAMLALTVLIPTLRLALVLYVVGPLALGRTALPRAAWAFRLSEDLKPWSMAEVFILGTAVALVKLGDMAEVGVGPAFWMFSVLALIIVLKDGYICRWSIWQSLETSRRG